MSSVSRKANAVSAERLKNLVERIEKLEEEKKAVEADIADVYAEAAKFGFDVETIRLLIPLRAMDVHDRAEQEGLLDIYKEALGL